jgi:hypothetical protein
MDTQHVFDDFVKDMQSAFPDITFDVSTIIDEAVQDIETSFFPHVVQIVKRDPNFFDETRMMLGMNLSMFWSLADKDETRDMIWKNILVCMTASLLHGDIRSKFTRILEIAKSVWTGSGQQNDEVTRILNDENSESRLKEIFDYVMETRIAKIFMEIMETFDPADLEVDISNSQQFMEILQNPEHPIIQKTIAKLQKTLADKLRRGAFTQEQFQREIETIKAKITSVFGGMFNDMLGGQRSAVPSNVLLGNSPEARRQRMKARLEKKVRDKK